MSMFDGGILTAEQIAAIRPQESEIQAYQFTAPDQFQIPFLPISADDCERH